MKLMASMMNHVKQLLYSIINLSGITEKGLQLIKQRPFMVLFLGAFLATGFLPLLTYLLFACAMVCVGILLLVVIEGGIITIATVILLVFLIVPACIASGLSLFAYTVCVGVSKMRLFVTSVLSAPQKRFPGEDLKRKRNKRLRFNGMLRFRRAKIISDVSGSDSDSEYCDAEEKKADP